MIFYDFLEDAKHGLFHKNGEVNKFSTKSRAKFLETVPFVFTSEEGDEKKMTASAEDPLDLPFQTCFFEIMGRPLASIEEDGRRINLAGLWINELSPKNYEILGFLKSCDGKTSIIFSEDTRLQAHFIKIIKTLLDRISKEEIGFNNPRRMVKMKIGGEKIIRRIDRVVYVSPKKDTKGLQASVYKTIDWSHQWSVRGHWREIPNKLGRDREGNPIMGNTWVRPYVKGPEDAPLISKTRFVK